jgi:branched-chain amino acid transport system ATP-binding protein
MRVLENLMLVPLRQAGERFWNNWARAGRVRREERLARERAMEVLELCDLGDRAGEIAGRLSGGQQKLLELARVLVAEPKLYLGAGRCRVPVTGEGGTTEKECSVNRAFVPSML